MSNKPGTGSSLSTKSESRSSVTIYTPVAMNKKHWALHHGKAAL